jgi:hypothetical protein
MSPRSAFAVDVAIEALWHREANGPKTCTLGSPTPVNPPKVAGEVKFTAIMTLIDGVESGEVYRLVIQEVAGHDVHFDGRPDRTPRFIGDE